MVVAQLRSPKVTLLLRSQEVEVVAMLSGTPQLLEDTQAHQVAPVKQERTERTLVVEGAVHNQRAEQAVIVIILGGKQAAHHSVCFMGVAVATVALLTLTRRQTFLAAWDGPAVVIVLRIKAAVATPMAAGAAGATMAAEEAAGISAQAVEGVRRTSTLTTLQRS